MKQRLNKTPKIYRYVVTNSNEAATFFCFGEINDFDAIEQNFKKIETKRNWNAQKPEPFVIIAIRILRADFYIWFDNIKSVERDKLGFA